MHKYIRIVFLLILTKYSALSAQMYAELFDQAVTYSAQQQYDSAISILNESPRQDSSTLYVQTFTAILYMNAFDDLGDTNSIYSADSILSLSQLSFEQQNNLTQNDLFWYNIVLLQRAFIMQFHGNTMTSALQIRSASKDLKELTSSKDAQAFAAVYDYYIEKTFSWVPFNNSKKAIPPIELSATHSRWFKQYFVTTLSWIYFEETRFDDALLTIGSFLNAHPNNRVGLQIKADLLFAKGDFVLAENIYLKSLKTYATVAPGSVRHLCAIGNLALIQKKNNNTKMLSYYRSLFTNSKNKPMYKWLPPSLTDALRENNIL